MHRQIANGPSVVFMTVGQQDAVDLVFALEEPGEIRNDDVNAEHVWLGEHDTTVNEHNAAINFNCCAISPDFAEATQEHHSDI
jgi:hypothetical protein